MGAVGCGAVPAGSRRHAVNGGTPACRAGVGVFKGIKLAPTLEQSDDTESRGVGVHLPSSSSGPESLRSWLRRGGRPFRPNGRPFARPLTRRRPCGLASQASKAPALLAEITNTEAIMATLPTDLDAIAVRTWTDPVVEAHGFPGTSPYVELFWLPILAPSASWLLRRLSGIAEAFPDVARVPLDELARSLGLGAGTGRNYWWTGGIPPMTTGSAVTTRGVVQVGLGWSRLRGVRGRDRRHLPAPALRRPPVG